MLRGKLSNVSSGKFFTILKLLNQKNGWKGFEQVFLIFFWNRSVYKTEGLKVFQLRNWNVSKVAHFWVILF